MFLITVAVVLVMTKVIGTYVRGRDAPRAVFGICTFPDCEELGVKYLIRAKHPTDGWVTVSRDGAFCSGHVDAARRSALRMGTDVSMKKVTR